MTEEKLVCELCKKPVKEADETYCYGCSAHICDKCDVHGNLCGAHEPDDHKEEE